MASLSTSQSHKVDSVKTLASNEATKIMKIPTEVDQRIKSDKLHTLSPAPESFADNTLPPIPFRPYDQYTKLQAGMPINAANAILGRGVTPHPHAATPDNTLNSLERLGNRLADDLVDLGLSDQALQPNKIAPSYERQFHEGLGEIDLRLATSGMRDSMWPSGTAVSPSVSLLSALSGPNERQQKAADVTKPK